MMKQSQYMTMMFISMQGNTNSPFELMLPVIPTISPLQNSGDMKRIPQDGKHKESDDKEPRIDG